MTRIQCDQIGRFMALSATFQSLWQHLFCPNRPHFQLIFIEKSFSGNFLMISFLCNFYRHLATFYWSHYSDPTTLLCNKYWSWIMIVWAKLLAPLTENNQRVKMKKYIQQRYNFSEPIFCSHNLNRFSKVYSSM